MKKRTLFYFILAILIIIILVTISIVYYRNINSLKTITLKDIQTVKLYPFRGATPAKEYTYNANNSDEKTVISNIINGLNTGKSVAPVKSIPILQGGTPPSLVLELNNGQNIEISTTGASENQVLITQSSTKKTMKFYSPELRKLFEAELQRIFKY